MSDGSAPGPGSGLDRLIAPEIRDDRFSRAIAEVAATPGVREILEIGASSGAGSTEAFVAGALRNAVRPRLHCIEVSEARFAAFQERWRGHGFVHGYHVSSVPLEHFASREEVERFWRAHPFSRLRKNRLAKVLGWLEQDLAYVKEHGLSRRGIREIKQQHGLSTFDAVLIDGSEFTGRAELDEVYGARLLLLDDTRSFKNWDNLERLVADPAYRLVRRSRWTRNGFAVFEKVAG